MTLSPPSRAVLLGLALAGAAGLALTASRTAQPAPPQAATSPACTSCDARHAHLAALRPKTAEGSE